MIDGEGHIVHVGMHHPLVLAILCVLTSVTDFGFLFDIDRSFFVLSRSLN